MAPGPETSAIGRRGESLAADFCIRNGYRIIARNHRFLQAEADLIVAGPEEIILVEVKATAGAGSAYSPLDRIAHVKRRALTRLAWHLSSRYPERTVRVDVITVESTMTERPIITHFPDVITFS